VAGSFIAGFIIRSKAVNIITGNQTKIREGREKNRDIYLVVPSSYGASSVKMSRIVHIMTDRKYLTDL
jgi:hypothetical protein